MIHFSFFVFIVATFAAFVLLLAKKWGFVEFVQVNGNDFFSEMFSCDFCLSWWAGVVLSFLCAIFVRDIFLLLVPFFSTAITRKLL